MSVEHKARYAANKNENGKEWERERATVANEWYACGAAEHGKTYYTRLHTLCACRLAAEWVEWIVFSISSSPSLFASSLFLLLFRQCRWRWRWCLYASNNSKLYVRCIWRERRRRRRRTLKRSVRMRHTIPRRPLLKLEKGREVVGTGYRHMPDAI